MSGNISFASFNLYNFQEAGKNVHGVLVEDELYEKKLKWTQSSLPKLDADIIAFQELWSPQCLINAFNTQELSNYSLEFIQNKWYNIAVAVAIRRPWKVKKKNIIKNFPFDNLVTLDEEYGANDEIEAKVEYFSRSIIHLTLEHSDIPNVPNIDLFATHLKSKLPTIVQMAESLYEGAVGSTVSTIRKTAEAAALRCILTEKMKGTNNPTVVIGDLNDDPRSNTLALLTEQPRLGAYTGGRDAELYSTLQLEKLKSFRDAYYTHDFNNIKNALDQVLVSEEFFESSNDAKWKHQQTQIWNDHKQDNLKYTNDHGIIKASFKYTGS